MNINEIEKAYQEWLDLPETKQERELFTLKASEEVFFTSGFQCGNTAQDGRELIAKYKGDE